MSETGEIDLNKHSTDNNTFPAPDKFIADAFLPVHDDVCNGRHTHYWLKGGRGSAKSSFVSIEIISGMMRDKNANALVMRKVMNTLKDSVYEQLCWAVDILGCGEEWRCKVSPLEMIFIPTGQKILFKGVEKPRRIKSLKLSKGYFKFVWYEELDEFIGMQEIDCINQSILRGGSHYAVFYTYNPPNSNNSWVNSAITNIRTDRLVHHSDYRIVKKEWLGEQFFIEAEHLKNVNEERYRHEYLGEVVGIGSEVFKNVKIRVIEDGEVEGFEKVVRGIDWGYGADPFVYLAMHFDKKRKRLFIFYEFFKTGAKFDLIAEEIKKENKFNAFIIAESAEPRSNDELRERGLRIRAAKKTQGSVEHGIKWLQDLEEIIIDPERCPNAKREFYEYELEKDKNGGFKAGFPDRNNHTIDTARYALEDYISKKKVKTVDRHKLGIY